MERMMARASGRGREWIDRLARFGFTARGLVYILVGLLAGGAAAGLGGRTTDTHGAMGTVGAQPFGTAFLLVIGLGLGSYALWRFAQALFDLEDKGGDLKGLAVRASYAGSGLVHAGLAFTAASLAIGLRQRESDPVRTWASHLMAAPYGRWVVGGAGLVVIGVAGYQFYKAYIAKFEDKLRTSKMSAGAQRWARRVGRAGLTARGITFAVIGWFLVRAALEASAGQARGLAGALRTLARQEHGPLLLGVVALGLTAYGLLSLVDSRYRRIT
jgi:hypothetical protein